jgi:hypothetical protein
MHKPMFKIGHTYSVVRSSGSDPDPHGSTFDLSPGSGPGSAFRMRIRIRIQLLRKLAPIAKKIHII